MRKPLNLSPASFIAIGLFAASLLLFAAGVRSFSELHDASANTSSFTLSGAGLSPAKAQAVGVAALEFSIGAPVLWSQTDETITVTDGWFATTNSAVISYEGDIRLLLPNLIIYPTKLETCVVSSAASEHLFGDSNAVGASMQINGTPFTVVDIVQSPRSFLVREGGEQSYTHITTRAHDADGFPITSELLTPTLATHVETLEYRALALLAHACLFLYPLALTGTLVGRWFSRKRSAITWLEQLANSVTLACAAIGATVAFTSTLPAFGKFYPTRWSDFLAWQEAVKTGVGSLAHVVFSQQSVFDEPVLLAAASSITFGLAALVALVVALTQLRWCAKVGRGKHARKQVG